MKHLDHLRQCLVSFAEAGPELHSWGLSDLERGWRNLNGLARALPLDVLHDLTTPLGLILPTCPVPDLALNNLERFLASPGGPELLPALLENRGRLLETLLHLFASSDSFTDLLARNPDYLAMLRVPLSSSPRPEELVGDLRALVAAATDEGGVLAALRKFRQRHLLRIGTNDIIRDRPLEEITRDLSNVADAALEVTLELAWNIVAGRFGEPITTAGEPARGVLLALGKHGGQELNYSSDLDLMFVYDAEGTTQGGRTSIGNDEYFGKVVSEVVRLLSTSTDRGQAYRIDLRLRPEGERGPLARSLASTLAYYDTLGRTWERQALIKVRPVAGDRSLGERFLQEIKPFVWRRYLSFAEINEIKALKRQIEVRTHKAGVSDREVKTGRGGIRDIEFTLQFLQLLNGGDLEKLRQRNTLAALVALEQEACLTDQEFRVLEDAYRFLRKTEHRLQLLFDLATHELPEKADELRRLALRMGYADSKLLGTASTRFLADYRDKTEPTRRILDHLLHDSFSTDEGETSAESDLILDPNPEPETIRTVLGRYPFRDIPAAYRNLTQLAQESVPFLSTRRCRQFLASIAPSLLRAIAETPDPDLALLNLEKVTRSLGGKTVLYELFSFNRPSLKLYVDVCAWSQFLSEILITNPGLIDELLDSLVLNQPRTLFDLRVELTDLCRGAMDLDPILHSFQDKELLRIGVRDILGKDSIHATTAALSDVASAVLEQVSLAEVRALEQRYGAPILTEGPNAGQRCRFVLLGLGKLGGQEMSYHSDLDLVLVYEGEGRTEPPATGCRREPRETLSFFTDLAQRIIKALNTSGPLGRLYEVDMRLRPTGKSGSLVLPLAEFRRYYLEAAHLWELQALTRSRVVHGDAEFGKEVMATVEEAVTGRPWRPCWAAEIGAMRRKLETSRDDRDLKRGPGGLMDVEFLVQLFQIKYGASIPYLRSPCTWKALAAAEAARRLTPEEAADLNQAYGFLSRVQSRLRIVHNRSLDRVPEEPEEIAKLARRLGFDDGPPFLAALELHQTRTRERFQAILAREGADVMGFEIEG
jgi:glutamate-ammonia-ligase adenylyltransferase